MERTPLNRCRSLMSSVDLPDHVRKRIMDEAACAQKRALPDQREALIAPRPFAPAQTGADRLATRRHRGDRPRSSVRQRYRAPARRLVPTRHLFGAWRFAFDRLGARQPLRAVGLCG